MSGAGGFPVPGRTVERLRRLAEAASPADPDAWAVRQGLGPLLLAAAVPDPAGTLGESRRRTEMRWQAALVHLERILTALENARVRALVLKGAALAAAHYPDPVWRPMGDLDLLVAPAQWQTAARVIEALDWTVEEVAEHGGAFAGPGGARLELHGALTTCPALFPVAFDDLFARSLALGAAVAGRRLGDEDTLVHLALHASFQHGFRVRLGQYVDFERVLTRPLDAQHIWARAAAARALRPLAASLAVAEALLEVAPSPALARRLEPHVPAEVTRWIAAARDRPWELLGGLGLARARWALAEGAVWRLRLLAGTLWPGRPDGSREVSPWKALARGRRLLQHL